MVASVGVVVVLSLLGVQLVAAPLPESTAPPLPSNIRVPDDLRADIAGLLARSPTLRAQCASIEAARHARITVVVTGARLGALTRARSSARRYDSGLLVVFVELPAVTMTDFAELLAHELEHAIELIEQIDLAALARQRAGGVFRNRDGVFETTRAQAAGRAAAAEVDEPDPTVAAISRGLGHLASRCVKATRPSLGAR